MTVNRQQTRWQRVAAWSALFAILLIVVAPLISVSLQKDPVQKTAGGETSWLRLAVVLPRQRARADHRGAVCLGVYCHLHGDQREGEAKGEC
jgi:hypothetical protein